jgi:hypothetical protein
MLKDSPKNLPGYSPPYTVKSKKYKKGRPFGGMLIFIEPTMQILLRRFRRMTMVFGLKQTYSPTQIKTPLVFCYVKPYVNKNTSESVFFDLENDISKFREKGKILICGDFNSRTGGGAS